MSLKSKSNFAGAFLKMAFILVLISGCTSARQYVPLPDISKPVDSQNARIFVLRPTAFGSAVYMKITENILDIGLTGANSFLVWDRAPGHASIGGEAENDDVVDVQVVGGETYYVQQHVRMGIISARNDLELLSKDEGEKLLKKCKPPKVRLGNAEINRKRVTTI